MTQISQSLLRPGHIMEVNFIIEKFMGLTRAERRRLYEILSGSDDNEAIRAVFGMLQFLTDADEAELTRYANKALGVSLSAYYVSTDRDALIQIAVFLKRYFIENLRVNDDEVSIDPIKP